MINVKIQYCAGRGQILWSKLLPSPEGFCWEDCGDHSLEKEIDGWMHAFLRGKKEPFPSKALQTTFSSLTPFHRQVLNALLKVSSGQIVSYRALAERAGSPLAWRAVGTACNKNPLPFFVPCHRVISSNGSSGGFAFPLEIKLQLLEFEKRVCK